MNNSRRSRDEYEVHRIGGEEVQHTLLARALTSGRARENSICSSI